MHSINRLNGVIVGSGRRKCQSNTICSSVSMQAQPGRGLCSRYAPGGKAASRTFCAIFCAMCRLRPLWGIGCLAPVRREAVCFSIWGGQFLASSPSSICATHAPKNHNLTKHTTRLHAPQKSGSVTIRAGVSLIWQGNTVYRNKECIKFSRADGSKNNAERRLCARALR